MYVGLFILLALLPAVTFSAADVDPFPRPTRCRIIQPKSPLDAPYTIKASQIFGDSLSGTLTDSITWPTFYASIYCQQAGLVYNHAVNGARVSQNITNYILPQIYSTTIIHDTIIWIGENTYMYIALSTGYTKAHMKAIVALAAYCILKPPMLNLTTASSLGVTLQGDWVDMDWDQRWNRGIMSTSPGANFTFPVKDRFVWIHFVYPGSVTASNNVISYTLDNVWSRAIGVIPFTYGYWIADDIILDRGEDLIGVETTFTLHGISAGLVSGISTIFAPTIVVGFATWTTPPTDRSTVIGPWEHNYYYSHTVGGPTMFASVHTGLPPIIKLYNVHGLDIKYHLPLAMGVGQTWPQGVEAVYIVQFDNRW